MADNSLMTTIFITYLALYPCMNFFGPNHPGTILFFPQGPNSVVFLLCFFVSDLFQAKL